MQSDAAELMSQLDPIPVFLSVMLGSADSDGVLELVTTAGLSIDLSLSSKDGYSHRTRLRALAPRIQRAVNELPYRDRLRVAATWAHELPDKLGARATEALAGRLRTIGWELAGSRLVPSSQGVRELFFQKGETHTAWSEIRGIVKTARQRLIVIDGFLDDSLFDLLKLLSPSGPVAVTILTREEKLRSNVRDLDKQLSTFGEQYSHVHVDLYDFAESVHDRFLVVDDRYYHLGASIKDAGKRIFMISEIETPAIQEILEDSIATLIKDSP